MSVRLSTLLLNDELTRIRRLEKLHHKKLFTMGPFRFRCLQYTVTYAAGNDRERGRRFVGFLTSPRQDTTTSSEIAVNVDAVQRARLTISSKLLALAKIVHDDDRLKAE